MRLLEEVGEETSTSAMLDAAEFDALYYDLPSYQPEPIGDLTTTEETRAIPPPSHQ